MNAIKKICGVTLTAQPSQKPIFKGTNPNETVEVRASYQNGKYKLLERSVTKFNRYTEEVTNPSIFSYSESVDKYLSNLNQRFNKGTGSCAIKK